jgi:hypothetical protein
VPLGDLFQALPGALLVGVIPGFALASMLVPSWRWWQWLAAAPGFSTGIVGVTGLAYHDAHIVFEAGSVLPVLAAIVLAAVVAGVIRRRRARAHSDVEHARLAALPTLVVVGAALLSGAVTAGAAVSSFRSMPLPPATDSPVHAFVAEATARTHDILPIEPIPANGGGGVRPRSGFEATAAAVSWLGGPRPTQDMQPLAFLAVLLIPMSLAFLALEASGSWQFAAVVPVLALGMPFPRFPIVFGEYPLLADSTLVVPLVIAALRALQRRQVSQHVAFVGVSVTAIWVVHGLEALTALLIGAPLILATIGWRWRHALRPAIMVIAAAAAGALVATMLTRIPATPHGLPNPEASTTDTPAAHFLGILGSARDAPEVVNVFRDSVLITPLALALFIAGMAAVLIRHRLRWALVVNLLLIACLADVGYGHALERLWNAIFPWAVVDRLLGMQYWVVPILMGYGLVSAVELIRAVLEGPRRNGVGGAQATRRLRFGLAGLALVAVAVTAVSGTRDDHSTYDQTVDVHGLATDADVAALSQMDATLPPGTIVLTHGTSDAGQWINAVTSDIEFAPIGFVRGILDTHGHVILTDDRSRALAVACTDPGRAQAALSGVRAIYVGSRQRGGDPIWDATCIARLAGVTPLITTVVAGYVARVFEVRTTD